MRHVGLLSLALILIVPVAARGQTVPSNYRYLETRHGPGLYGGYLLTDPGDADLGPQSAPLFGARYDFHLTGPLSIEANIGVVPTVHTVYARAAAGSATNLVSLGESDMVLVISEANLRFSLTGRRTWRGLAPFGLLGVGFVADASGTDELEAAVSPDQRFEFGPAFAGTVGLGTDFFLTERFSLRVEARDHLWRLTQPGGLTESGARENEWANNVGLTLGGAIHF